MSQNDKRLIEIAAVFNSIAAVLWLILCILHIRSGANAWFYIIITILWFICAGVWIKRYLNKYGKKRNNK